MATTYMNLTLPTVGTTVGPTWASQLNTAITSIDSHDHSSGKGATISFSSLTVNADMNFTPSTTSYSLTRMKKADFIASSWADSGTFASAMYVDASGNLHYVNSTSTDIQLTSGSAINVNVAARDSNAYGVQTAAISSPYQARLTGDLSYYKIASGGAFTFNLPWNDSTGGDPIASTDIGRFIVVKGPADAYSNNVTIGLASGRYAAGDRVNNAASFTIDSNNAAYTFVLRACSGTGVLQWDVV
tara:strand:+ start:1900 stop:2631 length:732 start_codon:yes stop_codon:yes gene_type:complete